MRFKNLNRSPRRNAKRIRPSKGYSLCKMISLGQNNKMGQKHAKNHSTITLQLFCAKNCPTKNQILEKWDNFENRPSCEGYSPCKGYSLCQIVRLGQKLKMPKTCKKTFYNNIRVVLCKNHSKEHQILEKWDNFENRPSCRSYSQCKGYSLCKMVSLGQKLKMPKTCEKLFYNNISVVLCKKPLAKTSYIGEMRQLWKLAILQWL